MFPKIGIGTKFFLREEATRTESILVLGESSQNNEEISVSSPLGKAFLGRGINEKISAKIEGIKGRWEILSIVRL